MLWETIDSLTNSNLRLRAVELRQRLESCSDDELALFNREADKVYRQLFVPPIYHLYCIAFEGEANGSGLTDFCSNLMLSGPPMVDAVLQNPDAFADVPATVSMAFNEDSGLAVDSIGWNILNQRHDDNVPQDLCERAGVALFDDIWQELERRVGPLTFEPDWRRAETSFPRVVARSPNKPSHSR